MTRAKTLFCCLLILLAAEATQAASTFTPVNYGAASSDESAALAAINAFRATPQNELYATFQSFGYAGSKTDFDALLVAETTYPGSNWWSNTFGFSNLMTNSMDFYDTVPKTLHDQFAMLAAGPLSPFVWDDNLGWAAHQYSVWVEIDAGATANPHAVSGAPGFEARFTDNGFNWMSIGENIAPDFPNDIPIMQAGFALDWGTGTDGIQDPPGHRNSMLSTDFTHVGIGIVEAGWNATDVTQVQHLAEQLSAADPIVYGYVTDMSGNRLSNVTVEVFNSSDVSLGSDSTDATGAYTIQYTGGSPSTIAYTNALGATETSSAFGSSGMNFFLDAQISAVPEPSAFIFVAMIASAVAWSRRRLA